METRSFRDVVVVRSPLSVTIGMFWHDGENRTSDNRQRRFLRYPQGVVIESVEKSVKVFMRDGSELSEEGDLIVEQWTEFDQSPTLFDLIVNAEEPEQAFISRYVLEG